MTMSEFNPILHASPEDSVEVKTTRTRRSECKCDSDNDDDFYTYKCSRTDTMRVRRSMCKSCYSKYQMSLRNKR